MQANKTAEQIESTKKLNKVIVSLDRVNAETKAMIFQMANQMSEAEIIRSFNQQALDMFTLVNVLVKKMGVNESKFPVSGYKNLFDNAIKLNAKLPLETFTLMILEHAAEIYEENEDCFLNMKISDHNAQVQNEFAIIKSDTFKQLWRVSNSGDKEKIKQSVIPLTTFAHAYFYKTVLKYIK